MLKAWISLKKLWVVAWFSHSRSHMQESAKHEGKTGVGNLWAPYPLYEALPCVSHHFFLLATHFGDSLMDVPCLHHYPHLFITMYDHWFQWAVDMQHSDSQKWLCWLLQIHRIQSCVWSRYKVWSVHTRSQDREYPHVPSTDSSLGVHASTWTRFTRGKNDECT